MGLVKSGWDTAGLANRIEQTGDRAVRGALAIMREEADKIADLARGFAPIDDGDLEKAIQVIEDTSGINGRKVITVQVDPNARNEKGVPVAIYGIEMHEGQSIGTNDGSYAFGLGKRSAAKDGGRGIVGGKFLERAARARMGIIGKRIKALLKGKL